MAKISFITKKLLKAGFEPIQDEYNRLQFINSEGYTIGLQFNHGSEDCNTLYWWHGKNTSDSMTDYFCESWAENVKQAFSAIQRHKNC